MCSFPLKKLASSCSQENMCKQLSLGYVPVLLSEHIMRSLRLILAFYLYLKCHKIFHQCIKSLNWILYFEDTLSGLKPLFSSSNLSTCQLQFLITLFWFISCIRCFIVAHALRRSTGKQPCTRLSLQIQNRAVGRIRLTDHNQFLLDFEKTEVQTTYSIII